MKNFTKLILTSMAVLFSAATFANHLTGNLLFSSRFSGANEVPAVDTDATGVGAYFLNANRDSLCITITVNGLSGEITGAHIHEGMAGVNGPVLVNFTDDVMGNTIRATVTGDDLTPELLEAMLMGGLYFNIHTAENPGGEIRSQIILEKDMAFHAMLDAEQEVADVESDATGLATFNLSKTGMEVNYFVVVSGLSGEITGAHLHNAPAGVDGPVIVNLTDNVDGNVIMGSFDPTQFDMLLDEMMAGNIYINVHTADNPGGEIRGQLMMENRISHDAYLNTEQEMPVPMNADGNGLALVGLNYTLDTLFYAVQVEGLTGEITGAHFHEGSLGNNGDVLIGITDNVMGNQIMGFVTGAALTTENINKFLSGGIYLNIHTSTNPAGEIRGQVYKLAREGYTYELTGAQEVPPVETMAYGTGIVSIDRDQTNVHFMMAYNDLTGPQTMAHFHSAPAGQNGDVIFTLSPFFDQTDEFDATFGYWTDMDETPFDAAAAMAFREGEVYVNVHTSENPSGELRGQVTRSLICSNVLSVFDTPERAKLEVYPNPTQNIVNLLIPEGIELNSTVLITDITGKTLLQQNYTGGNQVNFDISSFEQGIYILSLQTGQVNYTARIVRN